MEHDAKPSDDGEAKHSSQCIAHSDPAGGTKERCHKGGDQVQVPLKRQVADKSQEGFIGHGQPYDTQHQQDKDGDIAIVGDPFKAEVHETVIMRGEGFVQTLVVVGMTPRSPSSNRVALP